MVSGLEKFLPYIFALLIAFPVIVLLRQFVYSYISLKEKELKSLGISSNNEARRQAFERVTLFLERIKPAALVTRFDAGLAVHEFVFLTEKNLQEEYEYNVSQQLYISKNNWQKVVNNKNKILSLLYSTAEGLGEKANLEDFKTVFLMNYLNEGDFVSETIEDLKKEYLLLNINQ